MGWINNLRKSITHSNLLAGVLGSAAVHSTYLLHPNIEQDFLIYLFLFTGAWGLYILQRVMPHLISKPELITPRHKWFAKYKYDMGALSVFLSLISGFILFLLFLFHPNAFWMSITLGGIAVGYGARFSIGKWTFRGLRAFGNAKILLVGIVWASLTVFLPLLAATDEVQLSLANIFYFFGRVFVCILITIPFDIRDIELDQKQQLDTLIGKLGVKRSSTLGAILACIAAICYGISYYFSDNNLFLIPILPLLIYIPIFKLTRLNKQSDAYLYWVFDSFLLYEAILLSIFIAIF